ncbi:DUF4129 domain-containing protein [Flindersiella endophytica]
MIPAEPPIDIGRAEAADAAGRELSKGIYHQDDPSIPQRVIDWLSDWIERLLSEVDNASPGGLTGLLIIVGLIVVAAIIVRWRVGPLARARKRASAMVFTDGQRSAAEHRTAANAAAADGDFAVAIRERFRALVRELEERTLLDQRPGRTADEAAAEIARLAPQAGDTVRAAAGIFDEVWYGGRQADSARYEQVARADEQVSAIRRVAVTAS